MASNDCKTYHQSRRPSYDRAEKAREQLLFRGARISGPAVQQHLERSKAIDDEWRRQRLRSSGSDTLTTSTTSISDISLESMHNYGDSWFENLNALSMEYNRQKAAKSAAKTRSGPVTEAVPAMHGYGDSWFENLNAQREEYEHRKSEELERSAHQMHNYGTDWFEQFEPMWEDWQHTKMDADNVKGLSLVIQDSDDESCEIGQ
ncbi:uncharacterized protein Z518_08860 [Rhinocladiella mackenziei CBS 650.93]|uniref:Uncharacterized protein n=1 Tax=Rhinocladiella mackenziei CBS 650.93 TaxID=1442369 RepID=A0A0D2FLQ6_9EURO|nr:uncharacterized protein Z518_08860 [Rhinocladiella mackenziei CBS 650.93]KIX02917.1 hypothetical protein Z518_08860 [Rhinocladiella mackenziei CBS 650.93]